MKAAVILEWDLDSEQLETFKVQLTEATRRLHRDGPSGFVECIRIGYNDVARRVLDSFDSDPAVAQVSQR